MKATQGTTYRSLYAQIERISNRLQDLRTTTATGKKLNKPSDDPSAVRPVLNTRTQIRATERYLGTMGTALDRMQILDGHMDHVENVLVRVKELAINSINGTLDEQGLSTLADQVGQMKAELLDTANAQVDGKYIFAGFEESTRPFETNSSYDSELYDSADPATWPLLYNGDENATRLEISPGEYVQVNLTGCALFGGDADNNGEVDSDGVDIFATLTRVEEAMRANDMEGVGAELDTLDVCADQARRLRGKMGNNAQRVETAMEHMEGIQIDLQQTLSRYEDADLIEAIASLTQQEQAFEAALNVTAKVSQLSILDFI
jgi:flagellar hook-associated protein 3 FlgL